LKLKFILPTILTTLLLAVGLLYWLPNQFQALQSEELLSRGKLITEALDKASIGGLTVYDRQSLDQLAKGFFRSKEILYVVIIDKDGQIMADSGVEKQDLLSLKKFISYVQKVESDYNYRSPWATTGEDCIHLARPVFFEKVRVGSILVGMSTREIDSRLKKFQTMTWLLLIGAALTGLIASFQAAKSLSSKIRAIASGISQSSDPEMEVLAGRSAELNKLVESILTQKNLFKSSLAELEPRSIQLETELSLAKEENSTLTSQLSAMSKNIEELQVKLQSIQEHSKDLAQFLPILEFASGVAPEIDSSMRQVSQSASKLSEDFERVKNLIDLYEKALPQSPEDLEVIRQYKEFIGYNTMRESINELVATIRGGSSWAEQLADILKQISSGQTQ
jgi:methyl-accepting chemotaxis protein